MLVISNQSKNGISSHVVAYLLRNVFEQDGLGARHALLAVVIDKLVDRAELGDPDEELARPVLQDLVVLHAVRAPGDDITQSDCFRGQ